MTAPRNKIQEGRFFYGGVPRRPAVDTSRIRPACLNRISTDPLIFCQNTPRRGKSCCDECLKRNDKTLEQVIRAELDRLIRMAWERPSSHDHATMANRVADLYRVLQSAGLPTVDIEAAWRRRFERYRQLGGRAPFRELSRGYGW